MVKFSALLSTSLKSHKNRTKLLPVFIPKATHSFIGHIFLQIQRALQAVLIHPNQDILLTQRTSLMVFMRTSTQPAKISLRFLPKETSKMKVVVFKTNLEPTGMMKLAPGYSGTTTAVLTTGLKEATNHGSVSTTQPPRLRSTSRIHLTSCFLVLNR